MSTVRNESEVEGVRRAAQRVVTDSTYSSKGHFNAGSRLERVRITLGATLVVLATLASAASVEAHLLSGWEIGLSAITAAALGGVLTFYDPGGRAVKHNRLGSDYLALKKDCQVLIDTGLHDAAATAGTLRTKLDTLIARQRAIDKDGAQVPIPKWAYDRAREGIRDGEAKY